MEKTNKKVVVSLSGGRDSATCLGLAVDQYGAENVYAIGFEYGSKHPQELKAAQKIADYYGVPYQIITINPSIFSGSTCTLLKGSEKEVQKDMTYTEIMSQEGEGKVDTYVPARNTLFSAYALAKAESISQQFDCEVLIMLGQHADDSGFKIGENGEEVLDSSKAAYPDAVAEGTSILMGSGVTKPIENVNIGDIIWTFDENTRKLVQSTVINKYNKGIKTVHNAVGNLWVSDNHIMYLGRRSRSKFLPYSALHRKNASYQVPTLNYPLNSVKNLFNYEEGYLRGFWDGDGWTGGKSAEDIEAGHLCICQKNMSVLEEFNNLWGKHYNKENIKINFNNTSYDYKIAYSCLGGKDTIKLFDDRLRCLKNDFDFCLGYLNGIMIAEGWCTYNKASRRNILAFCQSLEQNIEVCNRIERCLTLLNMTAVKWKDRSGCLNWLFAKYLQFPLLLGAEKKDTLIKTLCQHYTTTGLKCIQINTINEAPRRDCVCYDLTTTAGTFIAEGVLVHNCSVDFVNAFAEVVKISSVNKVSYWTPFINYHKWQLIKLGMNLKKPVPYELCMSCYDPVQDDEGNWHECGRCATCLDVKAAMIKALENS